MKKFLLYIFLFTVIASPSQLVFGVGIHSEPNYKKMVKKAKTHLLLDNLAQVQLKIDFWKDKMPTTDAVKDYIQFNISIYANTGTANVKPLKAYFIYLNGKSSNTYSAFTYTYKNGAWVADDAKSKLQIAPAKVVVEFEDTQSKKTHLLKNDGPFKVEEVH